jgi:hypothetical protein
VVPLVVEKVMGKVLRAWAFIAAMVAAYTVRNWTPSSFSRVETIRAVISLI